MNYTLMQGQKRPFAADPGAVALFSGVVLGGFIVTGACVYGAARLFKVDKKKALYTSLLLSGVNSALGVASTLVNGS